MLLSKQAVHEAQEHLKVIPPEQFHKLIVPNHDDTLSDELIIGIVRNNQLPPCLYGTGTIKGEFAAAISSQTNS